MLVSRALDDQGPRMVLVQEADEVVEYVVFDPFAFVNRSRLPNNFQCTERIHRPCCFEERVQCQSIGCGVQFPEETARISEHTDVSIIDQLGEKRQALTQPRSCW